MNPIYDSGDVAIIRSASRARYLTIFDPSEVVFQARVAAASTGDTYLEIAYEDVTVGAYADIRVDQMVVVTDTSDHTVWIRGFRDMRVADTPTASVLPVSESEFVLEPGMYITVLDTYKAKRRARKGSLVDGRFAFEGLAPVIEGLPCVLFAASATTGSFTVPNVVGRSLTGGSITYLWEMDVTYDVGSDTSQNPEFTAPHGHQWGHLTVIDSNGPTTTMHFQIIVQNPKAPTLASRVINSLRINRTWQGHHATLRAYAGVTLSEVMNDTRTAIIALRAYKGGAIDADPVAFVGYLSKEQNSTTSPNDKSVTFDVAGIWERALGEAFNEIAVRDRASPAAWDDINLPTPEKVVAHILSRYSTILNLCSLNLDDLTDRWFAGDMNVNQTSLGEAAKQVASEINAEILQAPSGELFFRRDLRFEDEMTRDEADVVWTLLNKDLISLDLGVNHLDQVGRMMIGFRRYLTSRAPSEGGKALAPAVTLGNSSETQTRANQLLPADLSVDEMLQAAAQRVGDLLAYENTPEQISETVRNLAWMTTACHQWIEHNLLPATNTRGRALMGRGLIASVDIGYDNTTGTEDTQIEVFPETKGGRAIVVAMLVPNVAQITSHITSPRAAYSGSYRSSPTLNVPDASKRRPFSRKSMGGMGNPIPQDQGYEEGLRQSEPGHSKLVLSFKNSVNVSTGFTSVLGEPYPVTAYGSASVSTVLQTFTWDFLTTDGAPEITGDWGDPNTSEQFDGVGYVGTTPGNLDQNFIKRVYTSPTYVISVTLEWSPVANITDANWRGGVDDSYGTPTSILPGQTSGSFDVNAEVDNIIAGIERGGADTSYVANLVRLSITIQIPGTGFVDSFYRYEEDDEGNPINISLLGADKGLFYNNAPVTAPTGFNPTHVYPFEVPGSGLALPFRFQYPDYTTVQNVPLILDIEGEDAE